VETVSGTGSFETNLLFFQELPSMTLTKDHIVASIRNHLGVSKFESTRIVESVLEIIKTSLTDGDDVLISGFGKFTVRQKAARRGRNPATGEDLPLGPRRVVTFKCSLVLRERMNGKGD
jgi:integration host factor subunit alpha